jgi:flagellar hook-associated protein 1
MNVIRALNNAVSSLFAQQRRIETISHNIANANVEGYARQDVRLASGTVSGPGGWASGTIRTGTGVRVLGVYRSTNEVYLARANTAAANTSTAASTAASYARIEQIFPEPSDFALNERLGQFWSSWSDVSVNPEVREVRIALLANANDVIDTLRAGAQQLTELGISTRDKLTNVVSQINDLTGRIAELNKNLGGLNRGLGENHLADERDALMTQLAKLTGAVSFHNEDGSLEISAGGRVLVSGSARFTLQATANSVIWAGDGNPVPSIGGEAGALLDTINNLVPRYTEMLDNVAATLVSDVNTIHSAGFDLSGTTGRLFFDPAGVTAATISLSNDPVNGVAGSPERVAAAAGPNRGDGTQAQQIAELINSADGADAEYRGMISVLGIESRSASRRTDTAAAMLQAAQITVAQESGVSIDEELTLMIEAQRAYAAAARVITVVDELMATLIERTGIVGR